MASGEIVSIEKTNLLSGSGVPVKLPPKVQNAQIQT
jgi:hypothetical protein